MKNFEPELKNIEFRKYEKFSDANSTCSDLVNKIIQVINKSTNSTNTEISPQSFLTFSFNHFGTLV